MIETAYLIERARDRLKDVDESNPLYSFVTALCDALEHAEQARPAEVCANCRHWAKQYPRHGYANHHEAGCLRHAPRGEATYPPVTKADFACGDWGRRL